MFKILCMLVGFLLPLSNTKVPLFSHEENSPPVVIQPIIPLKVFSTDEPFSYTIPVKKIFYDKDPLLYVLTQKGRGALPSGMTFQNRTLSGKTSKENTYTFILTAIDPKGLYNSVDIRVAFTSLDAIRTRTVVLLSVCGLVLLACCCLPGCRKNRYAHIESSCIIRGAEIPSARPKITKQQIRFIQSLSHILEGSKGMVNKTFKQACFDTKNQRAIIKWGSDGSKIEVCMVSSSSAPSWSFNQEELDIGDFDDIADFEKLLRKSPHSGDWEASGYSIKCMDIHPNGNLLVNISDSHIQLLNLADYTKSIVKKIEGKVSTVRFSPSGDLIAAVRSLHKKAPRIFVFETFSKKLLREFDIKRTDKNTQAFSNPVSFCWGPKGQYIAVGAEDGTLHIQDVEKNTTSFLSRITQRRLSSRGEVVNPIKSIDWSDNGKYIALAGMSGQSLLIFDTVKRSIIHSVDDRKSLYKNVCFRKDSTLLAGMYQEDRQSHIAFWDVNDTNTRLLGSFRALSHTEQIKDMEWRDPTLLLTTSSERTVFWGLWKLWGTIKPLSIKDTRVLIEKNKAYLGINDGFFEAFKALCAEKGYEALKDIIEGLDPSGSASSNILLSMPKKLYRRDIKTLQNNLYELLKDQYD